MTTVAQLWNEVYGGTRRSAVMPSSPSTKKEEEKVNTATDSSDRITIEREVVLINGDKMNASLLHSYKNAYGESYKAEINRSYSNVEFKTETVEVDPIEEAMDSLNASSMDWKLRTVNGAVRYQRAMLDGCCGMVNVSNVFFGNIKEGCKELFYEEFEKHLLEANDDTMNRGAILMSDAVNGERNQRENGSPFISGMCEHLGWDTSADYYNPRSGHYVRVYIKEREVFGGQNEYPQEAYE